MCAAHSTPGEHGGVCVTTTFAVPSAVPVKNPGAPSTGLTTALPAGSTEYRVC